MMLYWILSVCFAVTTQQMPAVWVSSSDILQLYTGFSSLGIVALSWVDVDVDVDHNACMEDDEDDDDDDDDSDQDDGHDHRIIRQRHSSCGDEGTMICQKAKYQTLAAIAMIFGHIWSFHTNISTQNSHDNTTGRGDEHLHDNTNDD